MSIGNTQAYLDWSLLQDDREEDNRRECEEMLHEMSKQEREEYARWSDSLYPDERSELNWADPFMLAKHGLPYAYHHASLGEWEMARHYMTMTQEYLGQAIEIIETHLTTRKGPST